MSGAGSDALFSAVATKVITDFSSDIDLLKVHPDGMSVAMDRAARRVRINSKGSGALAYVHPNGSTGTPTGLLDGETLYIQVKKILASGTNVSSITVWW